MSKPKKPSPPVGCFQSQQKGKQETPQALTETPVIVAWDTDTPPCLLHDHHRIPTFHTEFHVLLNPQDLSVL